MVTTRLSMTIVSASNETKESPSPRPSLAVPTLAQSQSLARHQLVVDRQGLACAACGAKRLEGPAGVCGVTLLLTLAHVDSDVDSGIDIDRWIDTDFGMYIDLDHGVEFDIDIGIDIGSDMHIVIRIGSHMDTCTSSGHSHLNIS